MSQCQTVNNIIITPIKAFTDNYIWAIQSANSKQVILVDPGDGQVCIKYLKQHQLVLAAVFITHHHADHTGGLKDLIEFCQSQSQSLTIYGPKDGKTKLVNVPLTDNDQVELPEFNLSFDVITLPGHTLDHIAYYTPDLVFCGDTLFSGGCGRLFEGTPQQMHNSLSKLKALPEKTKVYCTHEYTLANLEFALAVEPTNLELIGYYNDVVKMRQNDRITLPSSINREKQINPFLRCEQVSVKESANEYANAELMTETDVFATIRQWKDNF